MTLRFTKMHGLGNDFILVDATQEPWHLSSEAIRRLANRHTGIGFDQLLVLEPATKSHYDFGYRIFNADGGEVNQCGNGARCLAHYIFKEGLTTQTSVRIATSSSIMELSLESDGQITVDMGIPQFTPEKIPLIVPREQLQYTLGVAGEKISFGAVSMGNPHIVIIVPDISSAPVSKIGEPLQNHRAFPQQINVGFMQILSRDHIRLRVFERGVGETQACGSGACAAVAIGRVNNLLDEKVKVDLLGGRLLIKWASKLGSLYMTGPAQAVFRGEVLEAL